MPYCTAADIAAYLGVTFTSPQTTQATAMSAAASAFVDRYCARTFGQASPVTNELHTVTGTVTGNVTGGLVIPTRLPISTRGVIFLRHTPVVAITAMTGRPIAVGEASSVLAAGTDYEILDATNGVVLMAVPENSLVAVSYTHGEAPPADVAVAATMIAAAWMTNTLQPDSFGLDSVALGQGDIAVKFSAGAADVPAEALTVLKNYRRPVLA